jgi:hypothetical protein
MRAISLFAFSTMLCAQGTPDAIDAFHHGQYAQARQMLEKIVTASPNDAAARTFLALSRAATGGCDTARPDLQQQFAPESRSCSVIFRRIASPRRGPCSNSSAKTSPMMPTCCTKRLAST